MRGGGSVFSGSRDSRDTSFDKDSTVGKLEQYARQVEDAEQENGSRAEVRRSAGAGRCDEDDDGRGARCSGGSVEALAPDRLKPFLPESLGGMTRAAFSTERNSAMGMQMTEAKATYT